MTAQTSIKLTGSSNKPTVKITLNDTILSILIVFRSVKLLVHEDKFNHFKLSRIIRKKQEQKSP